ncbi:MAG: 7-cyano-7-deazaguanine synthase [Candidatus Edwardsbacteria bacterium]
MKALVLFSGGLDSSLALRLVKEQGLEVEAINFVTVFCQNHRSGTRSCTPTQELGVKLKIVNVVSEEYWEIVKHPKYGYGKNLNPCIDCRIFMFRKAKKFMQEIGADFIVTGEVLGQRPMSQRRKTMQLIENESELSGLVLRPLSAKLLKPTIPEREGWVDRQKLLNFSGRFRKPQMKLAKEMQINNYTCPAGGCLLTDHAFAKRMQDLLEHGEFEINDVLLLKLGRHFRFNERTKLVIGRDKRENKQIEQLAKKDDVLFVPQNYPGPTALLQGKDAGKFSELTASIVASFSDVSPGKKLILHGKENGEEKIWTTLPLKKEEIKQYII